MTFTEVQETGSKEWGESTLYYNDYYEIREVLSFYGLPVPPHYITIFKGNEDFFEKVLGSKKGFKSAVKLCRDHQKKLLTIEPQITKKKLRR